jgi:hypothetical protein
MLAPDVTARAKRRKKGRKNGVTGARIPPQARFDLADSLSRRAAQTPIAPAERLHMSGPGRKMNEPLQPAGDAPAQPEPLPLDDDYEDGDIATPKQDHDPEDDAPL